jgi:hypothetical protein
LELKGSGPQTTRLQQQTGSQTKGQSFPLKMEVTIEQKLNKPKKSTYERIWQKQRGTNLSKAI